ARSAASLAHAESVGGWLYRVASRTAAHSRTAIARRRSRERPTDDPPEVAVPPPEPRDWHVVVHQEGAELPAVYRQALVVGEVGVGRRGRRGRRPCTGRPRGHVVEPPGGGEASAGRPPGPPRPGPVGRLPGGGGAGTVGGGDGPGRRGSMGGDARRRPRRRS